MNQERDPYAPVAVLVEEKDTDFEWMSAYRAPNFPKFSDIERDAKQNNLMPVALSQTAVKVGDTYQGALSTMMSEVELSKYQADPRIEQMKRMKVKSVETLQLSKPVGEPHNSLLIAPPVSGPRIAMEAISSQKGREVLESNKTSLGMKAMPHPREVSNDDLLAVIKKEVAERAKTAAPEFKESMLSLSKTLDNTDKAKKEGKIDERAALLSGADVAERAFLISEASKSPESRRTESRQAAIDPLFLASSSAARAASREGYKESFAQGLVSDVVSKEQMDRVEKGRENRKGDDFGATARKLHRVGLIDKDDPRMKVEPRAVVGEMQKPSQDRLADEKKNIDNVLSDDANRQKHAMKAKIDSAPKVDIKHDRPKSLTADNSVSQVGLSGVELREDFNRDMRNLELNSKIETDLKKKHEAITAKPPKDTKDSMMSNMARSSVGEVAAITGFKAGASENMVVNALTSSAASSNMAMIDASSTILKSRAKSRTQEER